ncbi:MAG: LlaJI family restriction endonuclease [Acetatifactor sp.]|nr:LlaJI family restriction endonuclease [Acetatifactor sp.]
MIIVWENDGQPFDQQKIEELGFRINTAKDLTGLPGTGDQQAYNFVGFLTNDENDMMAVFPKHFTVKDVEADSEFLFRVINKHRQRHPDCYLGDQYGNSFRSNYPFAAFFGIYDYYRRFGLYVEERSLVKAGVDGRISWKETIRRAGTYLAGGKVVMYPLYYKQKYVFSTFLTECMVFAINYTLDKFGSFLKLPQTGLTFPEFDYLRERRSVVERLLRLREQVFRDELLSLIDHLVIFYSLIREGGCYYWKCDTFSAVWEDMVSEYLRKYFCGVEQGHIVFNKERSWHLPFAKRKFYPNKAIEDQYIELDAYAAKGNSQYIFDAKYYTHIHGLDYKQLVYHLLLCEMREREMDGEVSYPVTLSALVLPGERRESRVHFEMDPRFNKTYGGMQILEEYLDIREVMNVYVNG